MLLRRLPALLVALFILYARPAAAGVIPIDWSALDTALDDCDVVHLNIQHNALNPGAIELDLDVGTSVINWKGVGIGLANGQYWEISTPGQQRHDSIQLAAIDVMKAQWILLGKAKFAGLHQGMYEIDDLSRLVGGDRVSFHWDQDVCWPLSGWIEGLPDWLPSGKTITRTFRVRSDFGWPADRFIEIHIDGLTTERVPVTTEVPFRGEVDITSTFTTPTTAGNYDLDFTVWQGSRSEGIRTAVGSHHHSVHVSATQPPPPPPPPPPPVKVKVPMLTGLTLADAEKALAHLGLVDHVQGADPSTPASGQIVSAQAPAAGTMILQGTAVLLDLTPPGWSSLIVVNCSYDHHPMQVYEAVNDGWQLRGTAPALFDDGGICPGSSTAWFDYALTDGAIQYFVAVDPMICADPGNTACRRAEAFTLGNSKGLPYGMPIN